MEPDFDSRRKMEMHNWVRYGYAPALEDMDRYNREVLGHKPCQNSDTEHSNKKPMNISLISRMIMKFLRLFSVKK